MCWLQPDRGKRKAALPGFFGAIARHHFLAGGGAEVALSDSGIGAAALWGSARALGATPEEQIAMLPAVVRAFRGRLGVAHALSEEMKAAHPEGEPHWYLAVIGGDGAVRGGGYRERADAIAAGPLRRRGRPGLPGVQQPREHPLLLPVPASVTGSSPSGPWRQPRSWRAAAGRRQPDRDGGSHCGGGSHDRGGVAAATIGEWRQVRGTTIGDRSAGTRDGDSPFEVVD